MQLRAGGALYAMRRPTVALGGEREWSGGCTVAVATTRSKSPESISSFTRPAIASPSGTASARPPQ